jgi:hypothetical protein
MSCVGWAITLNIAYQTSTETHFLQGTKAENEFAEKLKTLKHRFHDTFQIIFLFYKRQKMISKRNANV